MNRTQTACYCLMATAFVLAGILAVRLSQAPIATPAHAGQVIHNAGFSIMTAKTRQDDESLFVLDNSRAMLLIYRPNVGRRQLEPVTSVSLNELFEQGAVDADEGGGRRSR